MLERYKLIYRAVDIMKILIIEDDNFQSLNLKLNLNELGYDDIAIAHDLASVTAAITAERYDIIFCDIRLPDADGISLLSKYISPAVAKAVIIASVVDDSVRKLTMGMCSQLGYEYVSALPKPFKREELQSEIEKFQTHIKQDTTKNESAVLSDQEIVSVIQNHQFFAVYQPQFSFLDGKIEGIEALARIEHPMHGILPPCCFLEQISQLGLMKQVYQTILNSSVAALTRIQSNLRLSININNEMLNTALYDTTVEICTQHNFPLEQLTLELTEEQAFNPTPLALENLARLSLNGVRFSIDDFGTGYASLEQLIDLPISELKIDRTFITNIVQDYKNQQITKSALQLAQSLGLHCVAEGIEDQETWEYLKQLGVDSCQGYHTGKPMSIHELSELYPDIATNKVSTGDRNAQGSILFFDHLPLRGEATVKLLERTLVNNPFVFASNIESFLDNIKAPKVNFVIIESEALQPLSNEEREQLRLSIRKKEGLLITSDTSSTNFELVIPVLVKSDSIVSTAKLLIEHINQVYNATVKKNKANLSKREQHVAQLLLAGFSNKYISYELDVSPKTVSTFKTRILQKAGVKSIIELANSLNI